VFSHKNLVHFSLLSHACYMPRPPHSPWLDLPNDVWGWVSQIIRPVPRQCVVFRNKYWVLRGKVVSPPPNRQAVGPLTLGCRRLLIQYIRSYPPYLETVSSIRTPSTRHAVVTVNPLNMSTFTLTMLNAKLNVYCFTPSCFSLT
jgi:hypothetical protein